MFAGKRAYLKTDRQIMNIVDNIANAQGGAGLRNIANRVGLDEAQTRQALEQLAPVVAAGFRRNAQSSKGLAELLAAIQRGDHERYFQDATALDQARDEGNGILGHIFGSKEASREIAAHAASQTGIGSSILKQLLPIIASMVMGSMSNRTRETGLGDILGDVLGGGSGRSAAPSGTGGLQDILGDVLSGGRGGGSGGGLLESVLGGILGGGGSGGGGATRQRTSRQSQSPLDDLFGDILGGGSSRSSSDSGSTRRRSSSGNSAEDLLESVLRRTRR